MGRTQINQRERARSRTGAALLSREQSSKQRGGWIHRSLSAPSHAAGNGTLSQFDMHDSSEDAGMKKATDSKARDRSETREQWSKLPFSSLLKACLDWQEIETQIKLQTCKAGRGFPAGKFPRHASPMVLCRWHGYCRVCSNSYLGSGWEKRHA